MRRLLLLTLAAVGLLLIPVATANTPAPASVTIAGSYQSEAGCAGDWDPTCAATHLTYDAADGIWQGTFNLSPAGSYEYKIAIDDAWTENYGLHGVQGGANIPLAAPAGPVKFYYDPVSHW